MSLEIFPFPVARVVPGQAGIVVADEMAERPQLGLVKTARQAILLPGVGLEVKSPAPVLLQGNLNLDPLRTQRGDTLFLPVKEEVLSAQLPLE